MARIVARIRTRRPRVRILLRADSGFAREALMVWCENNGVDFLFGLAKNARLNAEIEAELAAAQEQSERTENRPAALRICAGKPARAGAASGGSLPSLPLAKAGGGMDRQRRQSAVCRHLAGPRGARGPPPLRKALLRSWRDEKPHQEPALAKAGECQLDLGACPRAGQRSDPWAGRTSAHALRANQLRLWFAAMAYVLIGALRRIGLAHTQFARASCGIIRLKLLKIGALVRITVRRIKLAMPSGFPYHAEYRAAHAALTAAATA
jgi:hypothetical protein